MAEDAKKKGGEALVTVMDVVLAYASIVIANVAMIFVSEAR